VSLQTYSTRGAAFNHTPVPLSPTTQPTHTCDLPAQAMVRHPLRRGQQLFNTAKRCASSFRARVLIGVAAAICAGSVPHMTTTTPCVTSRPVEAQQLVACSPQWLLMILSSARPVHTGLNSGSCVEKSLASMRRANVHAAKSIELRVYNKSRFFDPCSCEESDAEFSSDNMRESGRSSTSGTIVRQRAVVLSILHVLYAHQHMSTNATVRRERGSPLCLKDVQPPENFTVYNTEAHGEAHKWFANKFGAAYTASEYVSPSAEPASMHQTPFGTVRHEDLRALSFTSNSFDLVLSAEVFEHIPEPYVALNEVFRVLKPGGSYVWTVPLNSNTHAKDIQFSMLNAAGQRFDSADPAIKSPQFHGDPMAPEGGIVVFQIFGAGELLPKMCEIGFAYTHAHSTYDEKYGIVAPGGVMTMIARKPPTKAADA